MKEPTIDMDWSKLLGFDQVKPGTNLLTNTTKVGQKPCQSYRAFSAPAPETPTKS